MFPMKEFEKRFREILNALDEIRDACDGDALESMEEINAEYEDALFMLETIDLDAEDWREEFADDLEEFKALLEDYRALIGAAPELEDAANRLAMTISMAESNL